MLLAIIFRIFRRLVRLSLMYLTWGLKGSLSFITTHIYLYDFTRSVGCSPRVNQGITCRLQWKSMGLVLEATMKSPGFTAAVMSWWTACCIIRKGLTPLEMRTRSSAYVWSIVTVVAARVLNTFWKACVSGVLVGDESLEGYYYSSVWKVVGSHLWTRGLLMTLK